jgi:hypothetical protein
MTQPTTPFESDGTTLTSLSDETAFLQTVADETSATLSVAGTSTAGNTIHRMDIGEGVDNTLFITSLIHGDEVASREAILPWLRDMAYSTDPEVMEYLTSHRIVALTPCNPDGFLAGRRTVPNAGDPNRDLYRMSIKEVRVILGEFAKVRPHASLDAHEFFGGSNNPNDYWGFPGGNPIVPQGIQDAAQDWFDVTVAETIAGGYPNSGYYPAHIIMRAGMSTITGMMHSVGLLNETNAYQELSRRVAIQRIGFDTAWRWHRDNSDRCTRVVEQSREAARGHRGPLPLFTANYFAEEPNPQVVDVSGYQLAPGEEFPAWHVDAHNIVVEPNGFVPMQQEAAWVLQTLCDPDSPDRVVKATRVAPDPFRGSPAEMWVQTTEAGRREVITAKYRTGGETKNVMVSR